MADDTDLDEERLAAAQDLLSNDQLAQMDMDKLVPLRDRAKTKAQQDRLAPYEHRAFTREVMRDSPQHALGMAVAIPVYSAAKALGIVKSRSGSSLEEMKQAFIGMAEGLRGR